MLADPFDPVSNAPWYVRECWCCGYPLTHDLDDLLKCPVCCCSQLVPYATRYLLDADFSL